MNDDDILGQRRQQFLTLKYFLLNSKELHAAIEQHREGIRKIANSATPDADGQALILQERLKLVRLQYTAGEPVESLLPLYHESVEALAEWQQAYTHYLELLAAESGKSLHTKRSALQFKDLFEFEQAMDLVSLGVLLGDGLAVRRAAMLMESWRGTDMMFEAVVEPAVDDPRDIEEFFHEEPYGLLVDAIYTADTPQEASDFVKRYLDNWYKAFEGVPWHNGHLVFNDEYSNYEGYWAFDAAAVCVIHGIDDSSFRDHLVYPKDLADWARAHHVMQRIGPNGRDPSNVGLRREGIKPIDQAGGVEP